MICQNCGEREADIIVKNMVNGKVHNIGLCEQCADAMGLLHHHRHEVAAMPPSISITFTFANANPAASGPPARLQVTNLREQRAKRFDALVCGKCGLSYKEFREHEMLGCPVCYETFREPLGEWLQKDQGAESHWDTSASIFSSIPVRHGHVAAPSDRDKDIKRLKMELSAAISGEDYEKAARLRDELAALTAGERV